MPYEEDITASDILAVINIGVFQIICNDGRNPCPLNEVNFENQELIINRQKWIAIFASLHFVVAEVP